MNSYCVNFYGETKVGPRHLAMKWVTPSVSLLFLLDEFRHSHALLNVRLLLQNLLFRAYRLGIEFSSKLAYQVKVATSNDCCTSNYNKSVSLVAGGPLITAPCLDKNGQCVNFGLIQF